jgi:phosphoglycolate phosphatase
MDSQMKSKGRTEINNPMSSRFDSIVFDLDGTLWDTCPACAIAWNNVLQRNAIPFRPITVADVRAVTGKPHETCIRETFAGLPEETIQRIFLETIEEDNRVVREKGGELFLGVREGLHQLAQKLPLFIVSNCQTGYIETFLDFTGFKPLIEDFECWGNTQKNKSENLKAVIQRNKLRNPLMVGDAAGDHVAAKDCGVPFAFVEYGFGTCGDMDFSFRNFDELKNFILDNASTEEN